MAVHICVKERGTFTDRFFSGHYRWQDKSVVAMVERNPHLVLEGIPYSLWLLACPSGWHWISIAVFVPHWTLSAPGVGQWRKVTVVQMGRCLHRSVLPAFTDEGRQFVVRHFSPNWLDLTLLMASSQSECISTFCEAKCLWFSRTLTLWRGPVCT